MTESPISSSKLGQAVTARTSVFTMNGSQPQQQMTVMNVLLPHQQIEDQVVVKRSTKWWSGSTTNVQGFTGNRPANIIQEQGSPVTELRGAKVQENQTQISNLYKEKISRQIHVQQLQVTSLIHMFQESETSMGMTTDKVFNILSSESAKSNQVETENASTGNASQEHYQQQQSLEQLHKQQQMMLQQILLQKEQIQLLQQHIQQLQQDGLLGKVQTENASTVNETQQHRQRMQRSQRVMQRPQPYQRPQRIQRPQQMQHDLQEPDPSELYLLVEQELEQIYRQSSIPFFHF